MRAPAMRRAMARRGRVAVAARLAVAGAVGTVGLGLVGAGAAQAAPTLLGQWSLDGAYEDGASQVTPDASGNGNALKAANGSVHLGVGGKFASSTLATNTTPLQITSPTLAPAQLTLLAWVKQNGFPRVLSYIAGRGDDGGTCGGSSFAIYTGYDALPGLRFYARTGPAASVATDSATNASVFDGQWHLIAGTFDGTDLRFYVDGNQVGTPKPLGGPINYALSGGSSFYVDGYAVPGCQRFADEDDFPGSIDEVRLYDRALSATELARLAAAPGGPTTPAPALITDESLIPAPTPVPQPAAGSTPAAATSKTPKLVPEEGLKSATAAVPGTSSKALSKSMEAAAANTAPAAALKELQAADGTSTVTKAEKAKDLSAQEKKADPNRGVIEQLKAYRYGIKVPVQAPPGTVVEGVATVVTRQSPDQGPVVTRSITTAPGMAVAGADGVAEVPVPVDQAATAAMTNKDTSGASLSFTAAALDSMADLGDEKTQKLQQFMDVASKAQTTLENLLAAKAKVEQAIASNIRDGETKQEKTEDKQLEKKDAALDKSAKQQESARDAALKNAAQQTAPTFNDLAAALSGANGAILGGAQSGLSKLPTSTVPVSGCATAAKCKYGALEKKSAA